MLTFRLQMHWGTDFRGFVRKKRTCHCLGPEPRDRRASIYYFILLIYFLFFRREPATALCRSLATGVPQFRVLLGWRRRRLRGSGDEFEKISSQLIHPSTHTHTHTHTHTLHLPSGQKYCNRPLYYSLREGPVGWWCRGGGGYGGGKGGRGGSCRRCC